MRLVSLFLAAATALFSYSAKADDQSKNFVEFESERDVTTYDLMTVQLIQPGKFAIIYTVVSKPEYLRFQLKVLDTLRTHCAKADGDYAAPPDVLTLGPPDMPVRNIVVKSDAQTKRVSWSYPYLRFATAYAGTSDGQHPDVYFCKRPLYRTEAEEYSAERDVITRGIRTKQVYDCKRALEGVSFREDLDATKVSLYPVRKGTLAARFYRSVCRVVTHDEGYEP